MPKMRAKKTTHKARNVSKKERVEINIVCARIEELILEQYETIAHFAKASKMGRSTVYEILNNNNVPTVLTLIRFKNALKINLIEFFME